MSAPALVIVSIVGNDIRCDGTDMQHIPEFGQDVRAALDTITESRQLARTGEVNWRPRRADALWITVVAVLDE